MNSLTFVFMGDSITEGQYVAPSLRWTELVGRQVAEAFTDNEHSIVFHSRGISGETTRQGLERYPRDVQSLLPDAMTLQFGLNDCNCWDTDRGLPRVSEPAYRANLVEMIDRARRFGARQIVLSTNHCTLRHRPLSNGQTLEQRRVRYNEIVRSVAGETGATLCDIEKAFNPLSPGDLAGLLLPEPDVLHLSAEGHEFYAALILPYVMSAIRDCIASRRDVSVPARG